MVIFSGQFVNITDGSSPKSFDPHTNPTRLHNKLKLPQHRTSIVFTQQQPYFAHNYAVYVTRIRHLQLAEHEHASAIGF